MLLERHETSHSRAYWLCHRGRRRQGPFWPTRGRRPPFSGTPSLSRCDPLPDDIPEKSRVRRFIRIVEFALLQRPSLDIEPCFQEDRVSILDDEALHGPAV